MTKVEQGKGENVKKYILAGFILLAGCGGGTGAPEVNQATSTSTTTATETPKPDSPVTEESKKTEPLPEKDQPPVTSTKEPEKKEPPKVIINEAILTGYDGFANVDVKVNKAPLRTQLDNDPLFPSAGGMVVE